MTRPHAGLLVEGICLSYKLSTPRNAFPTSYKYCMQGSTQTWLYQHLYTRQCWLVGRNRKYTRACCAPRGRLLVEHFLYARETLTLPLLELLDLTSVWIVSYSYSYSYSSTRIQFWFQTTSRESRAHTTTTDWSLKSERRPHSTSTQSVISFLQFPTFIELRIIQVESTVLHMARRYLYVWRLGSIPVRIPLCITTGSQFRFEWSFYRSIERIHHILVLIFDGHHSRTKNIGFHFRPYQKDGRGNHSALFILKNTHASKGHFEGTN
jgi:hypothetical protein